MFKQHGREKEENPHLPLPGSQIGVNMEITQKPNKAARPVPRVGRPGPSYSQQVPQWFWYQPKPKNHWSRASVNGWKEWTLKYFNYLHKWGVYFLKMIWDFWWFSTEEFTCQCRRHRFNPWSGKIPHASKQLSPCTTPTGNPQALGTTRNPAWSNQDPAQPKISKLI